MDGDDAARVATTFDLGDVAASPTLAARGANGFIWKLTTTHGAFAVKRLQPWVPDERVPFDVEVQLAAASAGIPLPRPVLTQEGAAIVDRTRVYEWADVDAPYEAPIATGLARTLGDILGRLHALAIEPPEPIDGWYTTPPSHEQWVDLFDRGRAADAPWTTWLEHEIPFLDWENAGAMTPDAELAFTVVLWTVNGDRAERDAALALREGYEAASGNAPALTAASFGVSLMTHINFLKVNCDQSLDDEHHTPFTDDWIEQLQPARLRRRLVGIEELIRLLT